MAKISDLSQVTSFQGTEIIPIVVDSDDGTSKVNKVIDTTTLGVGIIEANKLINREELDSAISQCNQDTNNLSILLSAKSDSTHDHSGVYAEKTHEHTYTSIKGTPDLTVYVKNTQFEELSNTVMELESNVATNGIDITALSDVIVSLQSTISTLQESVTTLENKINTLENEIATLEEQLQTQS